MTYSDKSFLNGLLNEEADTNFYANGQKLIELEQFEFSTIPLRILQGLPLPYHSKGTVSQGHRSIYYGLW